MGYFQKLRICKKVGKNTKKFILARFGSYYEKRRGCEVEKAMIY